MTFDKINDILAAREGIMKVLIDDNKIRKADQLVQMIFTQPLTKVSHLTKAGIYPEVTARNYLGSAEKVCS